VVPKQILACTCDSVFLLRYELIGSHLVPFVEDWINLLMVAGSTYEAYVFFDVLLICGGNSCWKYFVYRSHAKFKQFLIYDFRVRGLC